MRQARPSDIKVSFQFLSLIIIIVSSTGIDKNVYSI